MKFNFVCELLLCRKKAVNRLEYEELEYESTEGSSTGMEEYIASTVTIDEQRNIYYNPDKMTIIKVRRASLSNLLPDTLVKNKVMYQKLIREQKDESSSSSSSSAPTYNSYKLKKVSNKKFPLFQSFCACLNPSRD